MKKTKKVCSFCVDLPSLLLLGQISLDTFKGQQIYRDIVGGGDGGDGGRLKSLKRFSKTSAFNQFHKCR